MPSGVATTSTGSSRSSGRPVAFSASPTSSVPTSAGGLALEHEPGLGRPVVQPDAVRLDRRDEAAHPDALARVRRQVHQVDVGRRGSAQPGDRGARTERRRSPGAVEPGAGVDPGRPGRPAPAGAARPSATSARCRGTIANRRSVAVGYGRFTMPVIDAERPSTSSVDAMPLPARPLIRTRAPPTWRSAVHRSPLRWTSTIEPLTLTSRHSTAAVGADLITWTLGRRDPTDADLVGAEARRAPRLSDACP